ncbi:MAG TPA: SH3 domain-containing protein [Pirellulales bacterium]|jgi:uncharacterized protein YgiM (DUF1202 family)|nr:SH3 domain-containing protein [Pirellulales bacterium]
MLARTVALLSIVVCWSNLAAAESFPYRAYIASDDVNVRSGPGDNYYPVMKLARGDVVEVYRHDPGGWYAIRPPQGCFSWISGEFLKPGENGTAVVIGDRVVARVGSMFSDIRDVIQVRLDRGEEVEVLEAKRFNAGPAAQTWYKITPPAGEFRWVSGKFVERELHSAAPRPRGPRNNMLLARMAREDAELDAELQAEDVAEPEQPRPRHRHPRREEPVEDEVVIPDEAFGRVHSPKVRLPESFDMEAYVDELDTELSAMVSQEATAWEFRDLKSRGEAALAKAETAVERGQARMLLAKIARFEDIRQRYVAVAEVTAQTDRRNQQLASRLRNVMPRPGADEPRYDGVGKLAQVVAGKDGSPQFALLDSSGEVRCYVSPSPGVNLRNYVGMDVGINGTLGYLPDQHAQHVTAKRIVPVTGTSGSTMLR